MKLIDALENLIPGWKTTRVLAPIIIDRKEK